MNERKILENRWEKKKDSIDELSKNIRSLRLNISKDLESDNEKDALTALVIAIMDQTGERVGNEESAENGHFGVTGLRKKHIKVEENTIMLTYTGKSGVKQKKSFTDERIAKALKKALRGSRSKYVFETSDGFKIKNDRVNRYLEDFNVSAKDLRGYAANDWVIKKLRSYDIPSEEKKRKSLFNSVCRTVSERLGHGVGTYKKHYMMPELPIYYIEKGEIVDIKNLGHYRMGGEILKVSEKKKTNILNTTFTFKQLFK